MTQHDYDARFHALLAELFMLEQADLDFGIYRVMNARRDEISRFLKEDLLPQIHTELKRNQTDDRADIERQIVEVIKAATEAGFDEDAARDAPKARALRVKLSNTIDIPQAERDVFRHLYEFFRRYYQSGDFLSLRRYKRDVYALPYEGEEVKLHWANADQYYIKTGEYFRDYTFALSDGRRVHFKLAAADTEQNNNKANGERERRFMLASPADFLRVENGELVISFAYQPDAEGRGQKDINRDTIERVFVALGAGVPPPSPVVKKPRGKKKIEAEVVAISDGANDAPPDDAATGAAGEASLLHWAKALMLAIGTNGNPERTTLEKHLTDYTAKNSFDYFIHKDLNRFLRRELDFYIKNEVMMLDDIEHENAQRVENYLAVIRAMRRVGGKIIEFLASLEDFQKRLWLKKKFVIETSWCVTLDRVPREFYAEIARNERQRAEWVRLFAIDEVRGDMYAAQYAEPLTVAFLDSQPHLVLDTSLFDSDFTERLLATFDDVEGSTDGVLIESENFQALNLLQARYREQIKCIYIDPPYNTNASEILYKNNYKHSSWLSLLENRLQETKPLLKSEGTLCVTIDDLEFHRLYNLMLGVFGEEFLLGTVVIRSNPSGRSTVKGFSIAHEYAIFVAGSASASVGRLARSESQIARYKDSDDDGSFEWVNFRKHGGSDANRAARPTLFYPVYVSSEGTIRIPKMEWDASKREWCVLDSPNAEQVIYPINIKGEEKRWKWGHERVSKSLSEFCAKPDQSNSTGVYLKSRMKEEGTLPLTWWDRKEYSATEHGTNLLNRILSDTGTFSFPKSVYATQDCLKVSELRDDDVCLDFFAGSGTTAHAVINLNREDDGARKFILVEMGEYFHTVTKPRVLKVIYSKDWRDGKPVSRIGSSCMVKSVRLESYEDTLNNLRVTPRTTQQQDLLAAHDAFRESYTLRYLFERDTAESPSLLNLDAFENPFDYRLDVSEAGSSAARVSTPVDLIETFNYLLGLRVTRRRTLEDFRIVEGSTLDGARTLIIWRNIQTQDNDALNRFFQAQDFAAQGFQTIYANGDHTLGMTRRDGETWQDRMIEADFKRLMFEA